MVLQIIRGETFRVRHNLSAEQWDPQSGTHVAVTDFTGWAFSATAFSRAAAQPMGQLAVTLETSEGRLLLEAPGGTASWTVGKGFYDVRAVTPNGEIVITPLQDFTVIFPATQA